MADTAIIGSVAESTITAQQVQIPAYITGTYAADDTDYHTMVVDARGKPKLTYGAFNASNKDVVITLYGSPSATAAVGDTGVFLIGTSITATATSNKYDTTDDGFPFYLIRCKQAATPNGETITVYAYLTPF